MINMPNRPHIDMRFVALKYCLGHGCFPPAARICASTLER
jgi:hypothetical protein